MPAAEAITGLEEREARLRATLRDLPSLLVAYSGGVDSAYLLEAAWNEMGGRCRGIIGDSASLPRHELKEALALAETRGWRVDILPTQELDDPRYAANPLNRCYFCKHELFVRLDLYAREKNFSAIAYGENADDARDVRPGRQAAGEMSILSPLQAAGLTKADVRMLSQRAGLPTATKPAQPCLASRIPHGLEVTRDKLARIEEGEQVLRDEGFVIFRLRHLENGALIQAAPAELSRLQDADRQSRLKDRLHSVGFQTVEFDPVPYQGASLR